MCVLAGCDAVWGLEGEPRPCELEAVDDLTSTTMIATDDFSVARDRAVAMIVVDGFVYERRLGELGMDFDVAAVPLGLFPISRVGIAPEGDLLLYVAGAEPSIHVATFDTRWQTGTRAAPPGIEVGAPSSAAFGIRRAFVREPDLAIREYIEDRDRWIPEGEPLALADVPNLTASGLTMSFAGVDGEAAAVFAADRPSVDVPFGEPRAIFRASGARIRVPQLIGARCDQLYVSIDGELHRYDR